MPKLRRPQPNSPKPPTSARPEAVSGPAAWRRVTAWLSPRRLIRAIFVDQVRLRRDGHQVVIALEPAGNLAAAGAFRSRGTEPHRTAPPATDASPAPHRSPAAPADRMHEGLRRLLDGRGESRQVLRHLAALEKRLGQGDAAFIHALSVATLQKMLRQLHGLVAPPPSDGIALLLAELQDTLQDRHRVKQAREATPSTTSFRVEEQPEVTELDPATLDMALDDVSRSPTYWPAAPARPADATTAVEAAALQPRSAEACATGRPATPTRAAAAA